MVRFAPRVSDLDADTASDTQDLRDVCDLAGDLHFDAHLSHAHHGAAALALLYTTTQTQSSDSPHSSLRRTQCSSRCDCACSTRLTTLSWLAFVAVDDCDTGERLLLFGGLHLGHGGGGGGGGLCRRRSARSERVRRVGVVREARGRTKRRREKASEEGGQMEGGGSRAASDREQCDKWRTVGRQVDRRSEHHTCEHRSRKMNCTALALRCALARTAVCRWIVVLARLACSRLARALCPCPAGSACQLAGHHRAGHAGTAQRAKRTRRALKHTPRRTCRGRCSGGIDSTSKKTSAHAHKLAETIQPNQHHNTADNAKPNGDLIGAI